MNASRLVSSCGPGSGGGGQELTARDKRQQEAPAGQLPRCLQDGVCPRIFIDEAKIELTSPHNSIKNQVRLFEVHMAQVVHIVHDVHVFHVIDDVLQSPGDAGDAGIEGHYRSEGLMGLGIFVSDG